MTRIELIQGDITQLSVDALVNAANTSLLGGGGVDGAIHRAAGPALLEACKQLGGCKTGEAKITPGFNLQASYVIHTPGPVYYCGCRDEGELLGLCYYNSLKLATENRIRSLAFPNISTGVYRFPKQTAAQIALSVVRSYLEKNELPEKVIFCCFDDENYAIYKALI